MLKWQLANAVDNRSPLHTSLLMGGARRTAKGPIADLSEGQRSMACFYRGLHRQTRSPGVSPIPGRSYQRANEGARGPANHQSAASRVWTCFGPCYSSLLLNETITSSGALEAVVAPTFCLLVRLPPLCFLFRVAK